MSGPTIPDAIRIDRMFDSERYAEVIELCSDVLSAFPEEWKFYYQRAHAKLLLGRRSEAIEDLTLAMKFQPAEPALYYFRGSWSVDAGNDLDGAHDLAETINAEANLGTSYYVESARFVRAVAFLHLGEFEKAKEECAPVRSDFDTFVKGRMWSRSEVLDRAMRRRRP